MRKALLQEDNAINMFSVSWEIGDTKEINPLYLTKEVETDVFLQIEGERINEKPLFSDVFETLRQLSHMSIS